MTTTAIATKSPPKPLPRDLELLTAPQLGHVLGLHRITVKEMHANRMLPPPFQIGPLGGRLVWRRAEIADWIRAGCPPRDQWQWHPTQLPMYDTLLRQRKIELQALEREIYHAKAQIENLEQQQAKLRSV